MFEYSDDLTIGMISMNPCECGFKASALNEVTTFKQGNNLNWVKGYICPKCNREIEVQSFATRVER